jgi:hypothetical protein
MISGTQHDLVCCFGNTGKEGLLFYLWFIGFHGVDMFLLINLPCTPGELKYRLMKMSPTVLCSVILLNPFGGDGFPIPTRE